jgi:hypothetical protein
VAAADRLGRSPGGPADLPVPRSLRPPATASCTPVPLWRPEARPRPRRPLAAGSPRLRTHPEAPSPLPPSVVESESDSESQAHARFKVQVSAKNKKRPFQCDSPTFKLRRWGGGEARPGTLGVNPAPAGMLGTLPVGNPRCPIDCRRPPTRTALGWPAPTGRGETVTRTRPGSASAAEDPAKAQQSECAPRWQFRGPPLRVPAPL